MKRSTYYQWLLALAVLIAGCTTDDTAQLTEELQDQLQDTSIPTDLGGMNYGGVELPKGTLSSISDGGSTLTFTLPKGIVYAALSSGSVSMASDGSYTCTSTCSGGCNVVKFGSEVGCSSCPKESTETCTGQHGRSEFAIGDGEGGGLIDLNAGVSFVNAADANLQLEGPSWEVLMNIPEVAKKFEQFHDELWGQEEPGVTNSDQALVNVFGTFIRMYIPKKLKDSGARDAVVAADVTCSCSSGSEGCTHEDVKKGLIKVGDRCVAGGCTSCTMNF